MANATATISVGTLDELNAAIAQIDAIGRGGSLPVADYTIELTANIALGTSQSLGSPLRDAGSSAITVNGTTVMASNDLYALNPETGVSLTVDGRAADGSTYAIDGGGTHRGFFAAGGVTTLQALQVENMVATGGAGLGGAGGGAGLGGGLFVSDGSHVTLSGVGFTGNAATGGAGADEGGYLGGGGGLGGAGGDSPNGGGGGVGVSAFGGYGPRAAGSGILLGEASGGGIGGGAFGGGGAPGSGGGVSSTTNPDGNFGGGGSLNAAAGFGGGSSVIRNGGFGGGGGVSFRNVPGGAGGFGAGAGDTTGGGGGLGAGGNIFVQQGGILTIADGLLGTGTVLPGAGADTANAGQAFGDGLFIQGNQTVTLAPGADQTLMISGVIADQTSSNSGSGALLMKGAGTVVLAAVNTFSGGSELQAGTFELGTQTSAGTGAITFDAGEQTLRLDVSTMATLGNTLRTLGVGDTLDLRDLVYTSAETAIDVANTLTVKGGSKTETFALFDPSATLFAVSSDGAASGTLITAYARPVITGTVANQQTVNDGPINPFATTTVADPNGGTDTLTIQLTDGGAGGTVANGMGQTGLISNDGGLYTLTAGSAAAVTAELEALVFTPTADAPGSSTATGFTLTDTSSTATAATVTDSTTTIVNTDAAAPVTTGSGTTIPSAAPVTPVAPTPVPVATAPVSGTPTSGDTPITGSPTNNSTGAVLADTVSIDQAVRYTDGVFTLSGQASSAAGISSVQISAVIDGGRRQVLGVASVNADGSFTFADTIRSHEQTFLVATLTDGAGATGTSVDPALSLRSGLHLKTFRAVAYDYTNDGMAETLSSTYRSDGSRQVDIMAGDQTLTSNFFDTFQNHENPNNNFVFDPGHGLDVVNGFRVDGTDHDTVNLLGSNFGASIAEVLRNTQTVGGSTLITDPTSGDTVRLAGITKAELKANQGDFMFHA